MSKADVVANLARLQLYIAEIAVDLAKLRADVYELERKESDRNKQSSERR